MPRQGSPWPYSTLHVTCVAIWICPSHPRIMQAMQRGCWRAIFELEERLASFFARLEYFRHTMLVRRPSRFALF
jgi:hypothetical protein